MTYYYYGTSGSNYFNYNGYDNLNAQGYGGNDTIWGNIYNDTISGGSGNDYLYGYSGNDRLYGGTGNDLLNGGSGNDYLDGFGSYAYNAFEYDTLTGGTGTDTFVLGDSGGRGYLGSGYATITDYNSANDYVQLKGNASWYSIGYANYAGGSALDTLIKTSGGDVVGVLQDTTSFALTSYYATFV